MKISVKNISLGLCFIASLSAQAQYNCSEVKDQALCQQAQQGGIGVQYYRGDGVTEDKKQAFYWFHKSAAQGNAAAQGMLGVMYRNGVGVQKDAVQAVYWWQKAAEQNSKSAQLGLGLSYKIGLGVKQNTEQANYYYNIYSIRNHRVRIG